MPYPPLLLALYSRTLPLFRPGCWLHRCPGALSVAVIGVLLAPQCSRPGRLSMIYSPVSSTLDNLHGNGLSLP